MKLEYCNEHSNCTIVDGEHTSRRPVVLPDNIVKQDQLDAFKETTVAKLRDLAVAIQSRFADSSQKVEDAANTLQAAVKDLKQAADALQAEFYTFREDASRRLDQALDEKKSTPAYVKTLGKQVAKIEKQFGSISDQLIKLDEAVKLETLSREAQIKQLVEL